MMRTNVPFNMLNFQCWEDLVVDTSHYIISSSEPGSQPSEWSHVETLFGWMDTNLFGGESEFQKKKKMICWPLPSQNNWEDIKSASWEIPHMLHI